jgi:hypothetical protein
MIKPISRKMHAVMDYGYAALIASAPETVGFKNEKTAATLCRAVGGGVFAASLLTRYELGAVPMIPFKVHLAHDVAAGLFTLGAPWLFGFSRNRRVRNTFVVAGAISVLAGLLTEPKEMNERQ